jgi:hypothetical protein
MAVPETPEADPPRRAFLMHVCLASLAQNEDPNIRVPDFGRDDRDRPHGGRDRDREHGRDRDGDRDRSYRGRSRYVSRWSGQPGCLLVPRDI